VTIEAVNKETGEVTEHEDATPERLQHSNDNFITADGVRRFQDGVLVRLHKKGALYPAKDINDALYAAGEKYYGDWFGSNMDPLKAMNYEAVSGGGSGSDTRLPASHIQLMMRNDYRRAREFLGTKYRKAVELLVLEDQELVAAGAKLSGASSPHACRAVAIERLTAGLFLLAKHYEFIK
jgi:hypothetical protein